MSCAGQAPPPPRDAAAMQRPFLGSHGIRPALVTVIDNESQPQTKPHNLSAMQGGVGVLEGGEVDMAPCVVDVAKNEAASIPSRGLQRRASFVGEAMAREASFVNINDNLVPKQQTRDQICDAALARVNELERIIKKNKLEHIEQEPSQFDKAVAVSQKYSFPLFLGVIVGLIMANLAPDSYETIFKTELLSSEVRPFDHKVLYQCIHTCIDVCIDMWWIGGSCVHRQ